MKVWNYLLKYLIYLFIEFEFIRVTVKKLVDNTYKDTNNQEISKLMRDNSN